MSDRYHTFSELRHREREGRDYEILTRAGRSKIAILAPHGGLIEPGTDIIADAIAGTEHTFYAFRGIKNNGNGALHITSTRFDEPVALDIVKGVEIAIVIHGSRNREETIAIGGRHDVLGGLIRSCLQSRGLKAEIASATGLKGVHPDNLCNRCRCGKGVQLEIPRGIRDLFPGNPHSQLHQIGEKALYLVEGVRDALASFQPVNQG